MRTISLVLVAVMLLCLFGCRSKEEEEKIKEVQDQVENDFTSWATKTEQEMASEIYEGIIKGNDISKAIIAQCFVGILKNENTENLKKEILKDKNLKYLVDSINHACG